MDSPQTTEYAVASIFNIANMKRETTKKTNIYWPGYI